MIECKVIVQKTKDNRSQIISNKRLDQKLENVQFVGDSPISENSQRLHIYIVTVFNADIKRHNNWKIGIKSEGSSYQLFEGENEDFQFNVSKIIASNDMSINTPRLPDRFIKAFCNCSGQIDLVNVLTEETYTIYKDDPHEEPYFIEIVCLKDNKIHIVPYRLRFNNHKLYELFYLNQENIIKNILKNPTNISEIDLINLQRISDWVDEEIW